VKRLKKPYAKQRFKRLIDEYVNSEGVKSLAGLALFLSVDRGTLAQWAAGEEDIGALIDYAKTCIEKDLVENGLQGKYNATMTSFILKCSFGYRDRGEEPQQGSVKIELSDELARYAG
jgi:hypothetical protein